MPTQKMPDRYGIVDEIGRGGMGVVYRARDKNLDREVALKTLGKGTDFHDTEARHRFEQEARVLAQLDDHPAIVRVHDFGIGDSGPYIVMRFVEGEDLREHLGHHGPLSPRETAHLGHRLAGALSHAHEEGVLHRDLKPRNVLVEDGDLEKALLADFGIAYLLERTTTAEREGTPEYMSPEQLRGEDLDERSDIYGLGAVLYECASGAPPYGRGRMEQVLYRILENQREPLAEVVPGVPSWLAGVVERCLSEEPTDRYESAEAVKEALQANRKGNVRLPVGETTPPQRSSGSENAKRDGGSPPEKPSSKHWGRKILYFVGVIGFIGLVGLVYLDYMGTDPGRVFGDGAQIQVLRGHDSEVESVSFSPSGRRLATASEDSTARIWDAASGAQMQVLSGHRGWVWSVAFSPDGEIVATGSGDETARLWWPGAKQRTKVLRGHNDDIAAVAFSPGGKTVATGSADATVRLWSVEAGREIRTFRGHEGPVHSVAFSPGGRLLATGSGDGTARVWSVGTGAVLETLPGHDGPVFSVAFSPDGKRIATGSEDGTMKMWSVETGQELRTLRGHNGPVFSVSVSPSGKLLATSSGDATARVWSVRTGEELRVLRGHDDAIGSVVFSPDGEMIATGSDDGTARLWRVPDYP